MPGEEGWHTRRSQALGQQTENSQVPARQQKQLVKRAVFQPCSPARDALVVELVDTQP